MRLCKVDQIDLSLAFLGIAMIVCRPVSNLLFAEMISRWQFVFHLLQFLEVCSEFVWTEFEVGSNLTQLEFKQSLQLFFIKLRLTLEMIHPGEDLIHLVFDLFAFHSFLPRHFRLFTFEVLYDLLVAIFRFSNWVANMFKCIFDQALRAKTFVTDEAVKLELFVAMADFQASVFRDLSSLGSNVKAHFGWSHRLLLLLRMLRWVQLETHWIGWFYSA